MILDSESGLLSTRGKWYLLRLPHIEVVMPTLITLMGYEDDPLAEAICAEKYLQAIVAYTSGKNYCTYVENSDSHWLSSPDIKATFLMDAMYFAQYVPSPTLVKEVKALSGGDLVLEY